MNNKYKEYMIPLGIFLTVFLYSSFFLQGLHLFDDDYNVCLANAHKYSLSTVLWHIFDPILTGWNTESRPTQTLIFKALFSLFEYEHSGYYYFKSSMLALFSTVYYVLLRRYLNTTAVAILSTLFLAAASSTFGSMRWVGDFVIVSEFLALLVYAIFLYLEAQENIPEIRLFACLALMVVLTLICDRTRASGKLIPGILFFYIVIYDWKKLKRYGLAIILMVISVVPLKLLLNNPAPFLHSDPGTLKIHEWQPASIGKFWALFGEDFMPFSLFYSGHSPISILAIIGFPLLYVFMLALVILIIKRTPVQKCGKFLIVWAAVNAASLMSYPTLPSHFQARYAISVLIPLIPLVLLAIYRATQLSYNRRWTPQFLIAALVVMQIGFHGYHIFRARNGAATFMIAADNLREHIATNYKNSFFYYQYFPVSGFRPTDDGNQFFDNKSVSFATVIYKRSISHSPLYITSPFPFSDPSVKLEKMFPGKSGSLYDRIFNSGDRQFYETTLYLYRYLPAT